MKFCLWSLIITAVIGAIVYLSSRDVLNYFTSAEAFKNYIKGFGKKSYIVFFIIQFSASILAPIPNNVTAAAGAAILGMWQAFSISLLATMTGSSAAFMLAKKFGKPITDKLVSSKVSDKYGSLIEKKGTGLLIVMFFLPFFPDDALCLLAGLSKISFRKFFVIMILTRPWGIWGSALVGAGTISLTWWGWVLIITGSFVIMKYSSKIEETIVNTFKFRAA
ncbi:VTT domain-containing protein [Clostridium swellfunianum]|nr:VTT domain-containing protein [Clostridium swellfunianum]